MSTFLQAQELQKRIKSTDDLRGYFQNFARPKGEERVGIECELFGVHAETGEALPYFGALGIEAVLKELAYEFGYEEIREDGHVIALQKENRFISLEPGGQIELSGEPVQNLHQSKEQLDQFFFELRTIAKFMGPIAWLTSGVHPFSSLENIDWVPKRRYKIMGRYLGKQGSMAHDMMQRTATNQINFDYCDENDAIDKMRLVLALTPIVAAMFANSSFSHGKLNGFASERLHIWRHTDPDRCGLILNLICQKCSFDDYLNYVLDVPMMFLVRDGQWMVTRNLTFRKFIEHGFSGVFPTQADFELHLSTIFTDARFKQYLEVRGMDGQRSHLIPAVYAFWKGILYDDEAKHLARRVAKRFADHEVFKLHQAVERVGLRAKIKGHCVLDLARELVRVSEKGLQAQRCFNEQEQDERIYLAPLKEEVLKTGRSPADRLSDLWRKSFRGEREAIIDFMRI